VNQDTWEFLADVDQLQADLAGSRTWERDEASIALRVEIRNACTVLSGKSATLGRDVLTARIAALGDFLSTAVHWAVGYRAPLRATDTRPGPAPQLRVEVPRARGVPGGANQ